LAMVAVAPMVPPSAMPLNPPSITGGGVSMWETSRGGRPVALGSS
jgi:hypothetical protein